MNEKLKALRVRAGMSQRSVARAVGLDPSTITRIENGEQTPTLRTVARLLDWSEAAAVEHDIPKRMRLKTGDFI